ncbi:MAG: hypothetical protein ACWGNI_00025 [Desulfobacterales bacterium]
MEEEIKLPSIIPQNEVVNLEQSIQAAEKYVNLMDRIRKMAIKLLNITDISNQGGKPYIEKSGCDKIGAAFGIQIQNAEFTRELFNDDKGDYYIYTCEGSGRWNNNEEKEVGVASSRDDFFGTFKDKGDKKFKPLSEVDPCDIKKKALTNFSNRIIKKLIGLSFSWEEFSELSGGKITQETVKKVEFGKGSRGGNTDSPDTKKLRDECRTFLLKLNDGEENAAKAMLIKETAFQGRDGMVPGKDHVGKLSEKQVQILHGKLKKMVEEFEKGVEEGYGS